MFRRQITAPRNDTLDWHLFDNFHRIDRDGTDAAQEVDNGFFVIGEFVGVEFLGDGGVFGFLFFVAFEDPLEGGVGAEAIFPGGGRNTAQGGEGIDFDEAGFFAGNQAGGWGE